MVRPEEVFVSIGGGDYSGVYFPTGLSLAEMVNAKRDNYRIRATVEATPGSTFNLKRSWPDTWISACHRPTNNIMLSTE